MKTAILFSGQGAQTVGMGKDIAAEDPQFAKFFAKADDLLGFPLTNITFDGPAEELTRTAICQPALYVHGFACLDALLRRVPNLQISAAAGLSLGEFTAHAAAGSFSFEDGLTLVKKRATAMQKACDETNGTMAAIIGADESKVRDLAAATDVDVANYNCPGQIVLSGERSKITLALSLAKEFGARKAVELNVAGAFHSRLMESAYQHLKIALEQTLIIPPKFPIVCNVDARAVSEPSEIRRSLAEQVTSSVRWTESIEYLTDHLGCQRFIELGPGGILAGLVARIRKGIPILSVSNLASLDDAVRQLTNSP